MKHSFSMRLLSVLVTLALVFTLTEPASAKGVHPVSGKTVKGSGESLLNGPEDELTDDSEDELFPDEERIVLSPEAIAEAVNDPFLSPFDHDALEIKDSSIRGELSEKRDEYQKQFYLTDGSYGSVTYIYPVHEKDHEGEWQEIDNRLASVKDPDGLSFYTREGLHDTVKFYKTQCKGSLYTVETGAGSISWGIIGSNEETTAEFIPVSTPEGYSLLVPKSAGDHLLYPGILPLVDASYRLIGHTLKEDLILKDVEALRTITDPETGSMSLSFKLSLMGYEAVQKDEKTVIIVDPEGSTVYELSAPLMTDASGAFSEELSLVLEPAESKDAVEGKEDMVGGEENVYSIRLTLDSDWLLSEERVFPVTIDPSLVYLVGGTGVFSCSTCYSASPNASVHTELSVGRSGSEQNFRAVFRLNSLPSLTEAETVIDARMSFVAVTYSTLGQSHLGPVTVNFHPLTESVNISNITWNTLSGKYSDIVTDSETVTGNYTINTTRPRVTWDVTKTVKDWYLTGQNYGMAMISENESSSSVRYIRLNNGMYSTDEAILPTFQITYLNQEGLENYLSTHSFGSDTMGTLSVGDFNGNLVYTYDDLVMTGQHLPVSLSHVWNASRKSDDNPWNASYMKFGKGMRLNLSLRIETSSVPGYPYKFTDADGTVHYFSLKSGSSGQTGSVYQKEFETTTLLTKTSSGYTLSPGGDLTYTFNSSGFLTQVSDITTGKSQTLTYSGGKLVKVKDGGGRETSFSYTGNGYLASVTDPSGRSMPYTYNTNNCLTTITRPDGKTVSITYISKGNGYLISKVTDIDGTSVGVTYYDSAPYRVKTLTEYSAHGEYPDCDGRREKPVSRKRREHAELRDLSECDCRTCCREDAHPVSIYTLRELSPYLHGRS